MSDDPSSYKVDQLSIYLIISENSERIQAVTTTLASFTKNPDFHIFESGIEALKACQQRSFDLIFCDFRTKFLAGWLFVKEFKNSSIIRNMPIILFSDDLAAIKNSIVDKQTMLKEYGICSIIHVPVAGEKLKTAMQQTLMIYGKTGTVENMYTKAKQAFIETQFDSSKKLFKTIYSKTPNLSRSNLSMSNVYKQEGNVEKMNQHLDKAVEADKENLSARYLQFEVAVEKGDGQRLRQIQDNLKQQNPEAKNVIVFHLSSILFKHNRFNDTLDMIADFYPNMDSIPLYVRIIEVKSYIKGRGKK